MSAKCFSRLVTNTVTFTTSSMVAPDSARTDCMFCNTLRVWAETSPTPTTLPSRSRAT